MRPRGPKFPLLLALALLTGALITGSFSDGSRGLTHPSELLQVSSRSSANSDSSSRVDVFIGFHERPGRSEEAFVRQEGGRVKHTYGLVRAIAANIPVKAADRIRNSHRVAYLEEDSFVSAVDHGGELDNTWGVKRIGAGDIQHALNTGTGVKVGILDSGIDTDHVDLAYDSSCSYNVVAGTATPEDDNGHGTHVAGTVAALKNLVGVVGAAPTATLCVYKVLDATGSGKYSDIVAGLDRAVRVDGVRITNNSYGSSGDPGTTVKNAFDNANAAGVLNVAAAGNAGNNAGSGSNCIYPARYSSVVATAATTSGDVRASFSSTCSEVELAAPGSQIKSTTRNGSYGTMSGTSMASPHAAGTAALVLAANPGWSNTQLRQRLQETAQDLGPSGRDKYYGFGLVRADLAAAVSGGPGTTTGSISGSVTSSQGGSAISGATVSLDTGQSTNTAADGTYSISDVPTGDRSATATASGFDPQTQSVNVSEAPTTAVNFALVPVTPPPSSPSVGIAPIEYATDGGKDGKRHMYVTVALVDESGNAVGGASVSVDVLRSGSRVASGSSTTGSDGRVTFILKNASSGCYSTVVTNVSAPPLTWDSNTPTNSFCKS